MPSAPSQTFAFRSDRALAPLGFLFGVRPSAAAAVITDDDLVIDFGPWHLATPLANIASVAITGPFRPWRVAGPARLSMSDRGITFATTAAKGVLIELHEPVPGMDPLGKLRHPNVTVTVDDVAGFVAALRERVGAIEVPGPDQRDDLSGLTASQLRAVARDEGIAGAAKMKKDDLLEALKAVLDQDSVDDAVQDVTADH